MTWARILCLHVNVLFEFKRFVNCAPYDEKNNHRVKPFVAIIVLALLASSLFLFLARCFLTYVRCLFRKTKPISWLIENSSANYECFSLSNLKQSPFLFCKVCSLSMNCRTAFITFLLEFSSLFMHIQCSYNFSFYQLISTGHFHWNNCHFNLRFISIRQNT